MHDTPLFGLPDGLLRRDREYPKPSELQLCEVHDVLAYGRCYIVKPVGAPRMPAMLGSQSSSMLPIGARDITMIVPGSIALCWISDRGYAVILSIITTPMGSSQISWPDSIVAAGNAGAFSDPAHQILTTKDTAHGLLDFSAGAPIDVLPGDWGQTNELGMAIFLGRLMASVRAGELCKLEMHYVDMLARLFAYNWQHYTAGSEDESFDDEGEWTRVRGFSPFPWESAGVNVTSAALFDKQGKLNPKDANDRFGLEPVEALQGSFVRYKEFEGFLGDLRRRFVLMPNLSVDRRVYGRESTDPAQYKGLFEEVVGADGGYLMRSAKGIGFEKTVWIPVPEEIYPRDNPKGDHDMTDAAGLGMDFSEYPEQTTAGETLARVRDYQAHDLNKRRSEPLNQRDKDWAIRDDITGDKIETPGEFQQEIAGLTPYAAYEQPLPASNEELVCPVGERSSRYYESKAFMGILPDGSILLRDGYGSEIRMTGGNVEITCPGDVVMRNGRTVQIWGGKDVIIKSHDNLEMSSATGSARLKAEHNLEVLGGNDGTGGVLIESRGSGQINDFTETGDNAVIGGMVLKSSRGPLGVWGDSLYLQSMSGDISMNSQDGDGSFVVYCGQLTKYLRYGSMEVVAQSKDSTPVDSTYVLENTGGSLNFHGTQVNLGVTSVNVVPTKGTGTMASVVVSGPITSEGTVSGVGEFNKTGLVNPTSLLGVRATGKREVDSANEILRRDFETTITGDSANGNKEVYGLIGFSFRSSTDLSLGDMVIYESEWQKRFRQTAGIAATGKYTSVWDEPDVAGRVDPDDGQDDQSRLTKPFPGKEAWDDGTGAKYSQVDDQFYLSDSSGGRPLPRGEKGAAYSNVEPPSFSKEGFKDRYPINR